MEQCDVRTKATAYSHKRCNAPYSSKWMNAKANQRASYQLLLQSGRPLGSARWACRGTLSPRRRPTSLPVDWVGRSAHPTLYEESQAQMEQHGTSACWSGEPLTTHGPSSPQSHRYIVPTTNPSFTLNWRILAFPGRQPTVKNHLAVKRQSMKVDDLSLVFHSIQFSLHPGVMQNLTPLCHFLVWDALFPIESADELL